MRNWAAPLGLIISVAITVLLIGTVRSIGRHMMDSIEPDLLDRAGQLLAWAAAAEADSEHPLARAIVNAAKGKALAVPSSSDFESSRRSGSGHVSTAA
ncbi:hypothetical protein SRABI98_00032 [Microbacterium sp. Bi98]|nr:hypothetical protein SRABI98_00032 [Microbacterium sp. Bi98]